MTQDRIYAFVEENMKTIFAYACSRVPHKQEAEDLAGDIIAALLAAAGRIRSEEALFGYVWTIAANTYKKYLRRKAAALQSNGTKTDSAKSRTTRTLPRRFCNPNG